METCKTCRHFIGGGDFGLCCGLDYGLWYEDDVCEKWEAKEDGTEESPTAGNASVSPRTAFKGVRG